MRHNILGAEKGSAQVYVQHPIPVFPAHPQQKFISSNSGIVHQDVYSPPAVHHLLYRRLGFGFLGNICWNHDRLRPGLGYRVDNPGRRIFTRQIIDAYVDSRLGQVLGDNRPDTTRCAGYQSDLPFEIRHAPGPRP